MPSITVGCPSCESEFAVKDTLIGKKVDCPKCKYRFRAEEPGSGDDDDKSSKSKKAPPKKGSNTLVIGGIIGVLAVILLAVGAYFIFGGGGGSGSSKPVVKNTNTGGGSSGGGSSTPSNPNANTGSSDGGNSATPSTPTDGGTATPGSQDSQTPKPAVSAPTGDLKNITNLLPGETIRIVTVHMDQLVKTPVFTALFDANTQAFFKRSLTFDLTDVQTYVHGVINPDRTNFGIFRLKKPIDQKALIDNTDNAKGPQSPINGKYYYNTLKTNPFIDAIGKALAPENLADEFGIPLTEEEKKKKEENKLLAYHVIDSHTVIIADQLQLERFLHDLDEKTGHAPYKSELTPSGPPPMTEPMNPGGGGEGGPGGGSEKSKFRGSAFRGASMLQDPPRGIGIGPGGPQGGRGGGRPGGPGGPPDGGNPDGGQPGGQQAPVKSYTSNPDYRTVDEQLKFMMNRLEEEDTANPTIIVYAEMIDQRIINQRVLNLMFRATNDAVFGLMSQMKAVGFAIRVFNKDKFVANGSIEFQNVEDARSATPRFVIPLLEQAVPILSLFLGTPIEIRNNAGGNSPGGGVGGGFQQGIPSGPQTGSQTGPGGGRGGPPGGGRGPGGPPAGVGGPPGGGGGTADGGEGIGAPGGGQPGGNPNATGTASQISVNLSDKATLINMEIFWNEQNYKKIVLPAIVSLATQMKGRMNVLSGETTWHSLSNRFPAMLKDKKAFPKGTIERELKADRFGLPFPPEQRTSFLADLLPYLSKGGLRSQIKADKFPWYAKENIAAAESWVPEFLVPYYPQTSWRAYHPMADGKVLGATNFVGLSGLGLDSARYDPANPDHAKKIGITGYNWGSTPNEITDGLSNTIYMIQVPPGLTRPWIAGGGATLMGVDDQAKNPIEDFVHSTPDKKRGTYVLMADGSVRWVTESVDPKVFKGMVTRAGGENLGDLEKLAPKVAEKKTTVDIRGGAASAPGGNAPATTPSPAPAAPADVDAKELAKFQGDWNIKLIVANGQRISGDQVKALGLVVKIEGDIMRIESKQPLPAALPNSKITKIDAGKNPKEITGEAQDGPTKGKSSTSVYEFVGELRLNIRSSAPGQPTPKAVRIPEEGSKDVYMELEKNPE